MAHQDLQKSCLRPAERIRKGSEFRFAYRRGARATTSHFVIVAVDASNAHARLGLSVSKKVGCAVVRNRVKRRTREAFRLNKLDLPPLDFVVIARKGSGDLNFDELCSELLAGFPRAAKRFQNKRRKPRT